MTAVIYSVPSWLGERLTEQIEIMECDAQKMTKTKLYLVPNWLGERLAEHS